MSDLTRKSLAIRPLHAIYKGYQIEVQQPWDSIIAKAPVIAEIQASNHEPQEHSGVLVWKQPPGDVWSGLS
jgi:hypothetical protein